MVPAACVPMLDTDSAVFCAASNVLALIDFRFLVASAGLKASTMCFGRRAATLAPTRSVPALIRLTVLAASPLTAPAIRAAASGWRDSVTTSFLYCSDIWVMESSAMLRSKSALARHSKSPPSSRSDRCFETKTRTRSARARSSAACFAWVSLQPLQHRTGAGYGCNETLGLLLHSVQNILPQHRQWCLRFEAEKSWRHLSHVLACFSAIHAVEATPVTHLCPPFDLASTSATRHVLASASVAHRNRNRRCDP
mmetsp:Transcript_38939/g.90816  ORF Transcript_38939/g.90816 Transcript_38939/m.90816 type:complete len:253 (-) Transcript_38939:184-942(-)